MAIGELPEQILKELKQTLNAAYRLQNAAEAELSEWWLKTLSEPL